LEGRGDDNSDGRPRGVRENITKIPDFVFVHEHPPEAVREVNFGKHDHLVGLGIIQKAEDPAEDIADLFHRSFGCQLDGGFVDGLLEGLRVSLAFGPLRVYWEGEVKDKTSATVLLWNHRHRRDFQLAGSELLEVGPEHNTGEARVHLVLDILVDQGDIFLFHGAAVGPTLDGVFYDVP
jgi:hypothetical protein